jgi:hypothetical protein
MATIKKKDLKKYKSKEEIDELVDADGSPIEGDEEHNNDTEIWTAPQQTSDDLASKAIQPSRFYYGADGTPYSRGSRTGSQKEGEENDGESLNEKEELDEAAEKLKKMVEDIVSKQMNNSGMVRKATSPDVNRNDIPDIDELRNSNPTAASHTKIFVDDIIRTPLTGDEAAIIINYILNNIDNSDMSIDYKRILKNKI